MTKTLLDRALVIATLVAVLPFLDGCHVCRVRQVGARFTGAVAVDGQSAPAFMNGKELAQAVGQWPRRQRGRAATPGPPGAT